MNYFIHLRAMNESDITSVASLFHKEYAKPPWNVDATLEGTIKSVVYCLKRGAGFIVEDNETILELYCMMWMYIKKD